MANPDWQQIITLIGGTIAGAVGTGGVYWKWLDYRERQRTAERSVITEEHKNHIESKRIEEENDRALITTLMSERKDYQEEIRNLRAEASQERARCDEELRKLREHFEGQRASDQQVYNAQIEAMREEIRKLISEVATLKAEAAHR
jgi:uncharacterized protein HemX